MGRLVVSLGALPLLALKLSPGVTRLGRARGNDIVLPLPEIADDHAAISPDGENVRFRAERGESFLFNGRPADEALLAPGDTVILGGYRLRWLAGEARTGGTVLAHESTTAEPVPTTTPIDAPQASEGGPVRRVIVARGRDVGMSVPFEGPALLIGRAPDCDLVLQDSTVSWRHTSLERIPGGVRVRDLGSRNGTYIDGRMVEAVPASAGARVRVGRTTLVLGDGVEPDAESIVEAGSMVGPGLAELTGRGDAIQKVFARIREAAASQVPILLLGETGTGKDLAARAVHAIGARASAPFVPVNCAAIPREMIENELFGHPKGAFEIADRGTIFLDEIAELPPELQHKLLRVVEDGVVPRVRGGSVKSDFRVVAATSRDLQKEIAEGRFRKELFFRLAVCQIVMPPLRDRVADLPDLVHSFLATAEEITGVAGAAQTRIEEEALVPLREQMWPGNIRELRNVILRAVVRWPGGAIDRARIEELLREHRPAEPAPPRPESLEALEREAIVNALRDCHGQKRAAARRLGIAESTIYEKLRRYGLTGERPPG